MTDLVVAGGPIMYPLVLIALLVVILGAWTALRVRRATGPDPALETGIDATLFWGAWAALAGLLGTLVGVYQAAGAIQGAGEVSASLVWGGIRVALITTLFGLLIFAVAALAWFGLRTWYRRAAGV